MHLLHLHCILLRQLYTCPALFGLMFHMNILLMESNAKKNRHKPTHHFEWAYVCSFGIK